MSATVAGLLVLLGLAVGLFGTLVGAGGGFILTPILLLLYPEDSPSTITAISLVVVFFNALSGSAAYARLGRIDYRSGVAFAAATVPGAIAGALLVTVAPRRIFMPRWPPCWAGWRHGWWWAATGAPPLPRVLAALGC